METALHKPQGMTPVRDGSSPASRTGVWVLMAAITMCFVAITSAMIVRQGASADWQHFALPIVLYFNTVALLASSVTLELARRGARRDEGRGRGRPRDSRAGARRYMNWLYATLGLAVVFLAGQCVAWEQLRGAGFYLATNPSASFFYLFTVLHAIHVAGGLAGLALVVWRVRRQTLRGGTLNAVSYYWHFLGVLWIYLLLLLWTQI